ncbi:MAG: AAA family ATPase [Spirochaetaceae bacterium]|nr:AAA family ATPase [Spirochaetaceae bacterium]
MFIARQKELSELNQELSLRRKSAVLVYGKRRIGKSTLIKEASKNYTGIVVNHLCVKSSFEGNLDLLTKSIMLSLELPEMKFATIFDLFSFINKQNKKILIILDEYQYLKESLKEGEVDSYMQGIIDSLSENIKIILCGSYIAIMKELLQESNPLFGRFTKIIRLEELDYYDSSLFYPNLPNREKIRFYSVFGGSPFVLANLNYEKTLEENIKDLLIEQNSLLRTHIESVMLTEIKKNYDVRILEIIGNGKKKYSELQNLLGMRESGLLDKQLKALLNMETITKTFPINKPNDKKKQFYEIKDNLMRFYFTYIFGNDSIIYRFGAAQFFNLKISNTLNTFISFRFEGMANQYFMRLARNGKLPDIEDFGSYWYDDKKTATNGQFDCVLKEKDGYDFYEVKFYEKPMSKAECEKEEAQVRLLCDINCKKVGFVCSAGFDFKSKKYELIDDRMIFLNANDRSLENGKC